MKEVHVIRNERCPSWIHGISREVSVSAFGCSRVTFTQGTGLSRLPDGLIILSIKISWILAQVYPLSFAILMVNMNVTLSSQSLIVGELFL